MVIEPSFEELADIIFAYNREIYYHRPRLVDRPRGWAKEPERRAEYLAAFHKIHKIIGDSQRATCRGILAPKPRGMLTSRDIHEEARIEREAVAFQQVSDLVRDCVGVERLKDQ